MSSSRGTSPAHSFLSSASEGSTPATEIDDPLSPERRGPSSYQSRPGNSSSRPSGGSYSSDSKLGASSASLNSTSFSSQRPAASTMGSADPPASAFAARSSRNTDTSGYSSSKDSPAQGTSDDSTDRELLYRSMSFQEHKPRPYPVRLTSSACTTSQRPQPPRNLFAERRAAADEAYDSVAGDFIASFRGNS